MIVYDVSLHNRVIARFIRRVDADSFYESLQRVYSMGVQVTFQEVEHAFLLPDERAVKIETPSPISDNPDSNYNP